MKSNVKNLDAHIFPVYDVPEAFREENFSDLNDYDFNLLAIDPGKTTGAIFWSHEKKKLIEMTIQFPLDYSILPDFIMWSPTIVVIEKPFMSPGVNSIVFEIFGFWKVHFTMFQIPVIYQTPPCKNHINNQYLIDFKDFSSIHSAEAYSHALYFFQKHNYNEVQSKAFQKFSNREIPRNPKSKSEK